ncbi:MAG TPA: CCA tRNA nucleotidyltransferase [Microthrixaceae bacterium]|nr:CCA tRNA nucleotidyltransferase [Microthrixaceae bacterium]
MIPPRARELLDEVRPLADRFAAADARIFLVGGVVRDLFVADTEAAEDGVSDGAVSEPLGDDIDLTTDAEPAEIKAIIGPIADALWTQGERFGTIGATIGDRTYEITTHRAEAYTSDSRKPEVMFSTDIEVDLSRRDFTVNAMALEVTDAAPVLIDPFGGLADLAAGVLRTPLDPEISFSDDPLRMLRAARFIAKYELVPTDDLVAAVRNGAERLEIVSGERIRDELCKLVTVDDPSAGLWFVHDSGLADMFFPELPSMRLEQDPIHRHKDVLSHTIAVVAKARNELKVRLAALFHDVGKPKTRSIGGNGVSFHHHEVVGARMTRDRMKALKFSNEMVSDVTQLVYLHLRFHTYQMGWTDAAVRRFVRDAGALLPELIALTRADCTTRNKRKAEALDRRIDDLEQRIADLQAQEALDSMRPDLDGQQVMAHLGIGPGREIGEALAHLMELRLDQGPLDESDAFAALDAWWAART